MSSLRQLLRRTIPGLIPVIRDQHALRAALFEESQVIGGKAFHAIARRDIPYPAHQNVSASIKASHKITSCVESNPVCVPHPPMRTGQIQVQRRAFAQVRRDLAAVDFGDLATRAMIGITTEPLKCSCPDVTQQSQPLQPAAHGAPLRRLVAGNR